MNRKRIFAGLLAALLLATGCSKKPKEMDLASYEELLTGVYEVMEGDSLDMTIPLPSETATALATASDGLTAAYTAPDLTVTGVTAGAQTVTLTFSDEGFADGVVAIPVTVTPAPPPQLEVALVSPQLGVNKPIGGNTSVAMVMLYGQNASLQLLSNQPGLTVTLEADSEYLRWQAEGDHYTLIPVQPGKTTLQVTASTAGFLDAVALCQVEIREVPDRMANGLPVLPVLPKTDPVHAPLVEAIFEQTNLQRQQAGQPALVYLPALDVAAATRATEAAEKWSHTRPDGTKCHTVFDQYKLGPYLHTGENLSCGNIVESGQEIVARWMASTAGHKEALLNPAFTGMGLGIYYDGEMYYYCQLFVGE